MRMPEPEEDKVTAIGGGLRASGLLKLSGIRSSLLKKGLFVLQSAWSTLHVSLREASLRMRMSSKCTYPMIPLLILPV